MLQVKLPFDDIFHSQNYKFVTGMKAKNTGDSKLNDGPYTVVALVEQLVAHSSSLLYSSI